jgi:Protein of unknown function (DUF3987)
MDGFPNFDAAKARAKEASEEWPEPVDILAERDAGAPILTERHIPDAIWPFVSDTAARMGVATSSVALAALVSCASMINEEWQIQPKRRDYTWTEGARLWGAIVGPPSILKSPVIAAATAPVIAIELAAAREHKEQMVAYNAAVDAWKAGGKEDLQPKYPRRDRYLVESATVEALQEVLRDDDDAKLNAPLGKVLVRQDELAEFIANQDRYTSGKGGGDRGAYLRAYNGGRYSVDRIGRGAFASNSWSICLLGGIQPDPIQRIAAVAVDDGLLQRLMLDVPPSQGAGLDRPPDRAALDAFASCSPHSPYYTRLAPNLDTPSMRSYTPTRTTLGKTSTPSHAPSAPNRIYRPACSPRSANGLVCSPAYASPIT